MIGKEFDAIGKEDIEALVKNAVCERRDLEYKQQLPGVSPEDTREFLADVSSFANAGGGDLIYGVRDKRDANGQPTGIPEAADGLVGINADQEERGLLSKLRDGIDPRIPGVRIKHLDGFPGTVIVLRVTKSWASPHVVKFRNSSRFYSRTSAGKHQLDVREIRAAFTASESLAEKMSAFRSDRVGKILAGQTPVPLTPPLTPSPKLVLHLLPLRAFSEPTVVDLHAAQSAWEDVKPMGRPSQDGAPRFNFNGLFSYGNSDNCGQAESYVQLFRNGVIEAVCAKIATGKLLFGIALEQELMRETQQYLKLQNRLGNGPPVFIAISVLCTKGAIVVPEQRVSPIRDTFQSLLAQHSISAIDQDVLLAPEVLAEEEGIRIGDLLRPALDTIWQASGWPGSVGYAESGEWVGYASPR